MLVNFRSLRNFSEDAPQRRRVRRENLRFLFDRSFCRTLWPQRLGGKSSGFFGCGSAAL